MAKKNEKAQQLLETISTHGWTIVEEWINQREEEIKRAGLNNIINLKASEFAKWQAYYAGELNILNNFKIFIKKSLETDKPKMRRALDKFRDILG